MNNLFLETIFLSYSFFKEKKIFGRYITLKEIQPIIKKLRLPFKITVIGKSYLEKDIYGIRIGTGKTKILVWSQMHGNESTGTKAIFDVFSYFNDTKDTQSTKELLNQISFLFIPMLNPDGAEVYSRFNAQQIDLNRDATTQIAPESKVLHTILHQFKPHYCFNLHDQRTLFAVGKKNLPATLSFLAPSEDESRAITPTRIKTMQVISQIYDNLKNYLPDQIGRYTDEFYPTATGDNFQKAGFPTILIEAGHFQNDYQRELTRKYNFLALITGFFAIGFPIFNPDYTIYFNIPNNKKTYFDSIYAKITINGKNKIVGIRYKEVLKEQKVLFLKEFSFLHTISDFGTNSLYSKRLNFKSIDEYKKYLTNKK